LNELHAERDLPTWGDGVDLTEALIGVVWFGMLGYSSNVLMEYAPVQFSRMMIDGCPKYSFYVPCITHTIFITLSFWGYYNAPTQEYLEAEWASDSIKAVPQQARFPDGIAILCLIGNLVKDLPLMLGGGNTDIWLHHIACAGSAALMLYLQPPGIPIFIITTACLEFGSIWYNLARLFYKSTVVASLYAFFFSLSNLAGLVGGTMFVMLPDPTDTATLVFKYVVYVINIGLCIMRQLDMHKTVKGTFAGTPTFPIVFPEGHPDFKGEQKTDGKKSN